MRPGSSLSTRTARGSSSRRLHANQRRPSEPRGGRKTGGRLDWQTLRFQIAAGLFAVIWVVLWGRAFYVQLVMGPELAEQAIGYDASDRFASSVLDRLPETDPAMEAANVWENGGHLGR